MKLKLLSIVLPACITGISLPAVAYMENYLPQGVKRATVVAPQKLLVAKIDTNQKTSVGSIRLSNEPDGLFLRGTTAAGKKWMVQRDPVGLGGSLYQCDLDRNGHPDLILRTSTGACGIAPPQSLCVILFDKKDEPHCYQLSGYFNGNGDNAKVDDLVSVRRGAPPLLLHQQLVYGKTHGHDNSYWRWQLFRAVNGELQAYPATVGGCKFPCYVWYKEMPNHKVSPVSALLEQQTRSQHEIVAEESAIQK